MLHKDVGGKHGCQESVENKGDFTASACRQVHLLNPRQIGLFPQKRTIVPVFFSIRVLPRWYLLQFHSGVAEFDGVKKILDVRSECWLSAFRVSILSLGTIMCTKIYGIEDEKGLFEPSISLKETDEARGLIFCMGSHIVTLTGATEEIFEFRSRSWDIGYP